MSIADYGFAIWETFYVTVLSTAFALVLGLPLGVLLVAGDKDGVLPLPGWLMHILNIVINILRSVPFLILMICVFPLTRVIVGTTVGTKATIVPLVVAAFPFVARLVETSLRELDEGVVEAAQSMGATHFPQIITKVICNSGVPARPDFQHDHGPDHHSGLLGHVRRHWRRRPGQDHPVLRLLPLPDRHYDRVCHPAGAHGAGVPERGHLLGDPERQAPAEVKECRKAFHGDGKVSLNHTARRSRQGKI